MAEIETPDYKVLKTIPSADYSRLYNVTNVETKILFPDNVNNWKEALGNDNYWFLAYTMRQYKKLVGEGKTPTQPRGDLRKVNGWEQTVLLPASEEAVNWLAYHNSQQQSQQDNEMILVALRTTCHNLAWHVGQQLVSFFQRAHSIQVTQFHNSGYTLDNEEQQSLRTLHLKCNAMNKFMVYTRSNDFAWFYGHTVHMTTMIQEWKNLDNEEDKKNYVHNTMLCMCLELLGQVAHRNCQEKDTTWSSNSGISTSWTQTILSVHYKASVVILIRRNGLKRIQPGKTMKIASDKMMMAKKT